MSSTRPSLIRAAWGEALQQDTRRETIIDPLLQKGAARSCKNRRCVLGGVVLCALRGQSLWWDLSGSPPFIVARQCKAVLNCWLKSDYLFVCTLQLSSPPGNLHLNRYHVVLSLGLLHVLQATLCHKNTPPFKTETLNSLSGRMVF